MSIGNSNQKPHEVKREEFRKYLEHGGVMETLTTALIALYEEREKPENPLDYVRKYFSISDDIKAETTSDVDTLKKELTEAKSEISELKEKLSKYESDNTV